MEHLSQLMLVFVRFCVSMTVLVCQNLHVFNYLYLKLKYERSLIERLNKVNLVKMREKLLKFSPLILMLLTLSCSTTPTGRRQLKLMGSSQMASMGDQSFNELKKKGNLSKNPADKRYIRCLTDRLLMAMNKVPSQWEVEVFEDETPNAFALPGQNVGVHTGMIKLAQNQHQLAAVIGHEIGHVLADHGNERVSQNILVQGGLMATQIALGNDSTTDGLIVGALGIGAQFGVLLPFSRKQETEADELGLRYMAEAGFDPRQAAELWRVMKSSGAGGQPEFLSTHPSPDSRIQNLEGLAPKYLGQYNSISNKPNCR
jgi:predicted Zn-dependent protease